MPGKRICIFGSAQSVHIQRWLAGLARRGYRIKLISLGGSPLPDCETVVFPHGGKLSYLWYAAKAAHEARKFRPDVLHVHYVGGFGLWGLLTGYKPTVVTVWGSDLKEFGSNPLFRPVLWEIFHRAQAITATSAYLKEGVTRVSRIAGSRTKVIPFGVEIPPGPCPLPPAPPVKLCYSKVHGPIYGPDILLDALAIVKRELPDIQLTMAGSGKMTEALLRQVRSVGVSENVSFVGMIPHREIYPLLREHHILVMPSLEESFGVAALEASACARPVIATDVGGIPEVVQHSKTGILVPPRDPNTLSQAILILAKDRGRQEELGLNGYNFARENYDWEKSLDLMVELYERVSHGRR